MSRTLFVNARQVVTCTGPERARRGAEMSDMEVRTNVAILVEDATIADVGREPDLRQAHPDAVIVDCERGVLTPGFVDSHTHAIFGRARFEEQELRAMGVPYMEISRRGGGIHASVRDLRHHTAEELFSLAAARLMELASSGVTTVEVKSGYGLSLTDELQTLRVARRLAEHLPLRIVPTWLGAHEIPLDYRERANGRRAYLDLLIHEMLPVVARERLARFADVFCEPGVFTVAESREILEASRAAGLAIKLHADELVSSGGAELAASLGAVSADHLAAVSDAGIAALAAASTVATLLPATMLFLGKRDQAPARRLIESGVPVALATDFNPGTSPTTNFPIVLTLGVSQLRLSVAEALVASTVNGAAALGLAERIGQLSPGFSADLALWALDDARELPYWLGAGRCRASWVRGKPCHPHDLALAFPS
ncbi:MAG: imidazolonepropionase [Gemmatimonadaceae bacterium]